MYLEEEEEIFVTVKDSLEVVIPVFPGRKVTVISCVRLTFAALFVITEYIQQQHCLEAYHVLQLGYYQGLITLLGVGFGLNAGHRRTAPSLMAAQLFGVCLIALASVATLFMILSTIIDNSNIAAHTDYGHLSLVGLQLVTAIVDCALSAWIIWMCKKSLEKYLGSYEAKEEVHKQFHQLYDHAPEKKHDHLAHHYLDETIDESAIRSSSTNAAAESNANAILPRLKLRRSTREDVGHVNYVFKDDAESSIELEREETKERKEEEEVEEEEENNRRMESVGSSIFSTKAAEGTIRLKERRASPAIDIKISPSYDSTIVHCSQTNHASTTSESAENSLGKSRYFSVYSIFSENSPPVNEELKEAKRQHPSRGRSTSTTSTTLPQPKVQFAESAAGRQRRRNHPSSLPLDSSLSPFQDQKQQRQLPQNHQQQQRLQRQPQPRPQPQPRQPQEKQQHPQRLDVARLRVEEMRRANAAAAVI